MQTDVDGLVEEVSIPSGASPGSPSSPWQQGSNPVAASAQQTGMFSALSCLTVLPLREPLTTC